MRSYGQYCSVAKALDVIGDRWNLLIVRELMLRGACRYTDLQAGLPGIATNLLAERLRALEHAGIVYREDAPPPVATTLFRLTDRGEELRPVMRALGRWGAQLMPGSAGDDEFRSHWLALPAQLFLSDREPSGPPIAIEVRTGDQPMTIDVVDGQITARPGAPAHPDLTLTGPPETVLAVVTGRLALSQAIARGLQLDGDPGALERLLPEAETRSETSPGAREPVS